MIKENYVRPAILADTLELAPKVRIGDRKEIMASDGVTPLEALVLPFTEEKAQIYSIIGTKDEGVIGMFGSSPTKLKEYGVVWLLSSEKLFKHTKQFIKECPYWVSKMSKDYKYVYNFVDERNWKALKWLQFLGFEPKEKIGTFGVGKMPFLLMMKEVNN
ncbi:hypothetical protein HTVC048P_gp40 [Pelagibacter phage HTVC048P]|uniref:hypothetical protein n=1 Tax=Pseudomonas simiae TaxID=321846 RepID=UPI0011649B44|nr:hypothetical protein [Pseudomonas simiae]AXH68349.1 hypothetical protein P021_gp40 [Pelagibacter phage HTVC021P]WMM95445.1 hypothetical protein HTVC048P_gp40 [Pelagibacter phage HTVC048P]